MRRFFEPKLFPDQKRFVLQNSDEVHHLLRVLRVRDGDVFELTDGKGDVAQVRVFKAGSGVVEVDVLSCLHEKRAEHKISLACAIPKKSKFETIIEKATELGVDEIIPIVTARTEAAGKPSDWGRKQERFMKTAIEAMKQSRRSWLPDILPVVRFDKAVQELSVRANTRLFIPWLEGNKDFITPALESARGKNIVFMIGPEGDFTSEEVILAQKAGARPVSLGNTVLKVDTAAIFVLAVARILH